MTTIETQVEYLRSLKDLTIFLGCKDTKKALSKECILAIIELQNSLRSRESKLAGYRPINRKNTIDACTTSPVEGHNYSIKHIFKCTSRMRLEKGFVRPCKGTDDRIKRRQNKTKREMSKTNMASCAPTAAYINKSGQGLADRNFDNSLNFKSAQVGPYSFIA